MSPEKAKMSDIGNNCNLKKDKKTAKKTILIVFAAMCIFMILYFMVSYGISKIKFGGNTETSNVYKFDYANYDENIFEDSKYMGYDRSIYYTDAEGYMTVTIDRENMDDVNEAYREVILFMMDYIDAMINGDVEKYNSCFDPSYYTGGRQPKKNFTQQKLYRIKLIAVDYWYDESGGSSVMYYNIGIEYMIKNNNGTLRDDMGSDALRIKYLTIKETDGNFAITDESYFSVFAQ